MLRGVVFFLSCIIIVFLLPFKTIHAEEGGIIQERYANIRSLPSVFNSEILTKALRGTALKILDKSQEKTQIADIEGYWLKIELIENGLQGWVFEKYVAREGSPQIHEYIRWVLSHLYYYRSDLESQISQIKKTVTKDRLFDSLKSFSPRFLNYVGYWLLAERNELALPILISFMDPDYEAGNQSDANYLFTWEILERLTPKVLITNNYKSFKFWWQKNWATASIQIPSYEMSLIFKKIHDNENRVYRGITTPQEER